MAECNREKSKLALSSISGRKTDFSYEEIKEMGFIPRMQPSLYEIKEWAEDFIQQQLDFFMRGNTP
jgi:mannose/fructose/N-acetylgalactosamine-specific phosphotransferase system component IID